MNTSVFLLVLISAFLHATWNFIAKKSAGNFAVTWLGLVVAAVVLAPFAYMRAPGSFQEFSAVLPFILLTGLAHMFYYWLVSLSYRVADISFAYPLSRGGGVLGACILAPFIIGERISATGLTGIILVLAGILLIALSSKKKESAGGWLIFMTALSIVVFSLVDKLAVGMVDPVFYIFGIFSLPAVLIGIVIVRMRPLEVREALRTCRGESFIIGLGSALNYLLILFAYRMAEVSYVLPAREFSVVIGALYGRFFLGERLGKVRLAGILFITAGLVAIRMA